MSAFVTIYESIDKTLHIGQHTHFRYSRCSLSTPTSRIMKTVHQMVMKTVMTMVMKTVMTMVMKMVMTTGQEGGIERMMTTTVTTENQVSK